MVTETFPSYAPRRLPSRAGTFKWQVAPRQGAEDAQQPTAIALEICLLLDLNEGI